MLCLIAIPILCYTFFKNIPLDAIIHNNNNVIIENFDFNQIGGFAVVGIIAVFLFAVLKVIEFVLTILAAVKASNGESYKYPLSIPFFK